MKLLDYFRPKEKALSAVETKSVGPQQLSWIVVGNQFVQYDNSDQTYIGKGYKALPNLYGVISLVTQKSSIVPLQVMKVKNKSKAQKYKAMLKAANSNSDFKKILKVKEEAFEVVDNTELEDLLYKPNGFQSTEELFEAHDGYLMLTGNSYFTGSTPGVGLNAKKITELLVLPAPMVQPIAKGMEIDRFKVTYYNNEIPAELVGHSKYFNPLTGLDMPQSQLIGMSPLMACRNLIKRAESADNAQGSMFTNMGPAGVLSGENGEISHEQALALQDRYDQFKTGTDKAGKISVSSGRLHWTQIGLSPVDLNIIEGKKEILGELCNVYHVPIGLFSENNSTDNNMDNARKMLITDAVIPLVEKRKQTLNKWLAPKFGEELFLEADYSIFEELSEDMEAKVNYLSKADWLTYNEKRQEMTFDPLPIKEMDKIYIHSGLIDIAESSLEPEEVDEEVLKENEVVE